MRDLRRLRALDVLILLATVAVSCGSGAGPTSTTGTGAAVTPSSGWADAPNPFTVIARYPTRSLGLRTPVAAEFGVSPNGDMYVADSSQRISVISPGGDVVRRWGAPGTAPGEFDFVSYDPTDPRQLNAAVTVGPNGDVYVIDSGNERVEVFSAAGTFIRQIVGGAGNGPPFAQPEDVVVDRQGDVFVADITGLSKFSPAGVFEWHVGGPASSNADLSGYLHLVVIDAHERLVVADEGPPKVVYVDEQGHEVDSFTVAGDLPVGATPCDTTVDTAGNTVVKSCALPKDDIVVYDRSHDLIGAWPDCDLGSAPRFFADGRAVGLASDDRSIVELRFAPSGG